MRAKQPVMDLSEPEPDISVRPMELDSKNPPDIDDMDLDDNAGSSVSSS